MAYTTINDPSAYFQTKLYTGGTAEAKTFDGNSNLKPDLFWSKKRGAVQNHFLADSVRGTTYALSSNTTAASYTDSETDDLASFDTNGFTFSGTGDTYNGTYQSDSYVAWCWSAAGNSGSANTVGDIASTVSVNTTAGFSIVKYTGTGSAGATVGHGLGVKPAMIIFKCLSVSGTSGVVYHQSKGATYTLYLNETSAGGASAEMLNNTEPTSSLITLGNGTSSNSSGASTIAYCFAEKTGYSKFGSYTGNANNGDGTFVYTGFKPAFIMVKNTARTQNWSMHDSKRPGYNEVNQRLQANLSDAESSNNKVDLLSNGFKWRTNDGDTNGYAEQHIYMAFAEAPLVGTNNIPCTAR